MKNLLRINGAITLSKSEQQSISGGVPTCQVYPCPPGKCCHPKGHCYSSPNCFEIDQ